MKTNLGQLVRDMQVLDEAASLAPLTRLQHLAVQSAVTNLRTALPELWSAVAKAEKPDGGAPKPEGQP